jgi:hypothetical protein
MLATLKNTTIRMIAAVAIPAGFGLVLTAHSLAAIHTPDNHQALDGPGGSGYPNNIVASTANDDGPGSSTPYVVADDDGPGLGGGYVVADDGPGLGGGYVVADDGPGLGGGYACSPDCGAIALDGPGGSTPYLF